ncbi:hypothetical protein V5R04_07140 [Jonesiaceae bacterium BS-20]|uniref:Lipoprotein n=1 Tax=Jonesiaceae bacterium BS-20 TaxID=3120821 RepID=A0AAU7E0Y4_9MICO
MSIAPKIYSRVSPILLGSLAIMVMGGCGTESQPPISEEYKQLNWNILEDEAHLVAECVEEQTGFTVRVTRGGYIEYTSKEVPDAQWDIVGEAAFECDRELVPQAPKNPSEESLKTLYSLEVDAYRCLTNEGYSVSAPVSEATFIESVRSAGPIWSPLFEAMTEPPIGEEEFLDLLEKCPDPTNYYWR